MPPSSTVPPSGTLTVVVTVVKMNSGNWMVVPLDRTSCSRSALALVVTPAPAPMPPTTSASPSTPDFSSLLLVFVDREPSNWNSSTFPICEKKGTSVSRTNRRSLETTACTLTAVPSESTVMTGCWAAAKSPTTGITLVTNGRWVVSDTKAFCPLKSVTFGACITFERVLPWAA